MLKTKIELKQNIVFQSAAFIISFIGGYFLSDTGLNGILSFADISLTGALSLPNSAAVLIGSLIHSILNNSVGRNIVKISSMIIIVIIKLFFENKTVGASSGIISGITVFISGMCVSVFIGDIFHKIVFYVIYGVLTGFSTYSFVVVTDDIKHKHIVDLSYPKSFVYAVFYIIIIATLSSVELVYLNIGVIIGIAVTLLAAYHYRYSGGVLCGAITTCGAFLSSFSSGMPVVLLPVAGLLTGYLYKSKRIAAAFFFVTINFVFAVFIDLQKTAENNLLNILCSAVIFLVISPYFSDKWIVTGKNNEVLSEIVSSRMSFLADSIENIRNESCRISEYLAKNSEETDLMEYKMSDICKSCYRRLECWYNSYEDTKKGFKKLSELPEITMENFPVELNECLHKSEVSRIFEKYSLNKMTTRLMTLRFSESRKVLSEQLKIMEEIINSAGSNINVRYSESLSRTIRIKLEKYGYNAKNVIAYYNNSNRLLIEIYFTKKSEPSSYERLCDLIADEVKISLNFSEPVNSGNEVRVRIYENTHYTLEAYGTSICADNSEQTGDTSSIFSDGMGMSCVILSDGMGTGKTASLESRMVVSLFRRLISSGVNYITAIKLINSIMHTKSSEEAFATLDALMFNLDNGEITLIKSGASATLIRHKGKVIKITSPSFPIGIFQESDTFACSYNLDDDDMIIMFSDGISENEYRFIKELLLGSDDIKAIVDEICGKAEMFNPDTHSDDVTVIGMKLINRKI